MGRRFNIRKYTLFIVFLFSIQLIGLSATASSKTVRVGVYQNKPLSFIEENGKVRGLFIDLLEYIASEEGWRIEYNHCSFPECLSNLREGDIELLGVIAYSESRGKFFNYTNESVITNWGQMYLNKKSDIESIIDLEGKKVAVLHGDIYFENLKKLVDQFGINCRFIEAFEYEDVLDLVELGRCEAGMVNQIYGLQFEKNYDIVKSSILVSPKRIYWATAKGKNSELLYSLDKHLKKLKKDEQSLYNQAINKWFGIGAKSTYGKWIKWIAITFPFLLVLFISANVILRAKVKSRTKELLAKNDELIKEIKTRKRAEKALRGSEAKYRFMTENMSDIIWTVDMNYQLIYVSPSVERLLGYSIDERLKQSLEEQVSSESLKHVVARFNEEIERDKDEDVDPERTIIIEVEYYHKDGSKVWMENSVRMMRNQLGELEGMHGVSRDISDRKNAEFSLKESEERYSLATKGSDVGVWDWDLTTGKIFVSKNLKKMLGYDDHEIKNHIDDWGKNVYPGDVNAVLEEANACVEGSKREYRIEHRMIHKDGSIRWFLASGMVERDATGKAIRFVGTDTDITKIKELEEKLRQSHKMEALGTLSGGIAHEFNNILGIIIGNSELAIDEVPDWNPAKDCLMEIRTASLRAKDVVRQIMSFSRKTPITQKPIRISTVIQESLKLMRATIPSNIEIFHEILCDDELIMGNPTEINQIFLNLCSNSVDALEEGTGKLNIRLETATLDHLSAAKFNGLTKGDYVKLTVRDNGMGIDPKLIGLVFDPYFTTKDVDKGLGMGLAVVYGIVKKHDGAIRINSTVGKETSVEVLFPITKETEKKGKDSSKDLPRGTERILFVDDEASLVRMTSQMLQRQGYEVLGKTSSNEALKFFQEESDKFDLVITDMAMPQMTGEHLAQELFKIRPNIPVIICTGHSDRIDESKARKLGFAAYSLKPIIKTDFVNTVRNVLDRAKSENQQ